MGALVQRIGRSGKWTLKEFKRFSGFGARVVEIVW